MDKSDKEFLKTKVYLPEREKSMMRLGSLNIDIKVLQRTQPSLVVARKTLKSDNQGNPLSTQDVSAGEHLKTLEEQRSGLESRLIAIDLLIKNGE